MVIRIGLLFLAVLGLRAPSAGEVRRFADLTSAETARLDFNRTVLLLPGAIQEEHGPYLPNGSDGIFSQRLAEDLAAFVGQKDGWTAVMFPSIPLGAGAANEIGSKYRFPGSATIRPSTLRTVFMDLADQLGAQGFRWIFVVHGHGDPAHNKMLDEAGDYFGASYDGVMINVFGYVWAMPTKEFRTPEQQSLDGLAEHATMTETSVILALQPGSVEPGYRSAAPQTGQSMDELQRLASAADWPGYFGAPALASAELGAEIYDLWLDRSKGLMTKVLAGESLSDLPRYGTIYADDPADAAALLINAEIERKQTAWLKDRKPSASKAPPR